MYSSLFRSNTENEHPGSRNLDEWDQSG